MAYKTDLITKRLNKVERQIFPPESVAGKVRALSPADRAVYDRYKQLSAQWMAARPGEQAYIDMLACIEGKYDGEPMPELPSYIKDKIYPRIKQGEDPRETYMNLLEAIT